jgi:hypothetical protein
MIDPRSNGGVPIGRLPMVLTHVRTLEAFDTPLVMEFKSETGDPFLQYWCDRDRHNRIDRWIVLRASTSDLAKYLVGIANARDLIVNCRDRFVFLLDTLNGEAREVFYIRAEALPEKYVPAEESFADAVVLNAEQQDVFIDENLRDETLEESWVYKQVSEYPRKFLQAYSFNAIFGPHGDAQGLGPIDYRLSQGWVYHTLFNWFDARVPVTKRAKLIGVSFSSPGYVRFKVNAEVASDLRLAVAGYLANRNAIASDANILEDWTKEREPRISEDSAERIFVALCDRLRLNGSELLRRFDTTTTAVKALSSYLRRLEYIATREENKTAMLVGLKRPQ